MAPQGVGYEDFDVLELCKGKRNPSHHKPESPMTHVHYQQHQMTTTHIHFQQQQMSAPPQSPMTHIHYQQHHMSAPKKETINSHDAAKIYGGLLIVDNRRNKIPPRSEAIDCIEAAKKYDGVLIVDCRYNSQPLRKPYY